LTSVLTIHILFLFNHYITVVNYSLM